MLVVRGHRGRASPRRRRPARVSSGSRARSAPRGMAAADELVERIDVAAAWSAAGCARDRAPRRVGRAAREHAAGVRARDRARRRLRRVRRARRPRRLVVTHDAAARRGAYPTLAEVLDLCHGRIGVMVELKRPRGTAARRRRAHARADATTTTCSCASSAARSRRRARYGRRSGRVQHVGLRRLDPPRAGALGGRASRTTA